MRSDSYAAPHRSSLPWGAFFIYRKKPVTNMKFIPAMVIKDPLFTKEECELLINTYSNDLKTAKVGKGKQRSSIRKTIGVGLEVEDTRDIYDKCVQSAAFANSQYWGFDIASSDQLQLLKYTKGSHYDWHLDIGSGAHINRKLSFIVPLSSPDDYEGGELIVKAGPKDTTLSLEQGKMILFPSFILHKVSRVLSGERYVLVGWFKGKQPLR